MTYERQRSGYYNNSSGNTYSEGRRQDNNKYSRPRYEISDFRGGSRGQDFRMGTNNRVSEKESFSLELRDIPDEMHDVTILARIGSPFGKLMKVHLNLNRTAWLKYEAYEEVKLAYKILPDKLEKFGISTHWPYKLQASERYENRSRERERERERGKERGKERERERGERERERNSRNTRDKRSDRKERSHRKKSREKEREREREKEQGKEKEKDREKSHHRSSSSSRKRNERKWSDQSGSDSEDYSQKKKNSKPLKNTNSGEEEY
ncbi:pre-mRNA 3'-end-processing factor fip1 [Anaeramoeba flamelloides]|uniref:Pre-mRNA 3'-end-processing factor fip1 n=1 Tax=Anaeramoeba flamelloides TaxID=1746091 RepID=A0AAV7ZWR9_9EUKA|nr:pre-mRNA 3'-end-processing factor fip1 [Anaeramoeba flamelloides]